MSETPYQQVLTEWKALSRILGRNRNDLATTRAIASRLWTINDAIGKYIIYGESATFPDAAIKRISEAIVLFLKEIQCTFSEHNKCFIHLLHGFRLTSWEMQYCLLEAIGFTGREIGMMTRVSRHYIYSSRIRKKFNLNPHDTNIGNYLRIQLEMLDSCDG